MHCDIVIYSYSKLVSIFSMQFWRFASIKFAVFFPHTKFIVQFAFRFYYFDTILFVIHYHTIECAFGCIQTIRYHHFISFHTKMLDIFGNIGKRDLPIRKGHFGWMIVVFDFQHKIERVHPHLYIYVEHLTGFNVCCIRRFRIGSVVLSVNSLNVWHRSKMEIYYETYNAALNSTKIQNQTSTLAYLTQSHFMHHRFESKSVCNMDVCMCGIFFFCL